MNSTDSYLAVNHSFLLALQITVGITCVLSILGASLIILTYVLYKDLRTMARQLLVNLSVADILVAVTHIMGLFYFENFLLKDAKTDVLCTVQAAFLMLGTIASFLWTIALSTFLLTIIVLRRPQFARILVIPFYVICWGIPVVLVIWFGSKRFFGFKEGSDIAWCYIKPNSHNESEAKYIYPEIVGYEAWILVIFIVLPVLNVATICGVRCKLKRVRNHGRTLSFQTRVHTVDLKLIFVPLILFLLRIWSTIIDIQVYIVQGNPETRFLQSDIGAIIILLAGIGDSAQGLANAILFCGLTKSIRNKLYSTLKHLCCLRACRRWKFSLASGWEPLRSTTDLVTEPTTLFEESIEPGLLGSEEGRASQPLMGESTGRVYNSLSCVNDEPNK